jgi:uncharacterized protein YoxC
MTTLDLFLGIATVALIVLTFFACWTMYYVVGVLQRIHQFFDEFEKGMHTIGRSLDEVTRRAEVLKTTVEFLIQSGKTLMSAYQRRSSGKRAKKEE